MSITELYKETNNILNNYNNSDSNNINTIIDDLFNANNRQTELIIKNIISDILFKQNIKDELNIIFYIIDKIDDNPNMFIINKIIILYIIFQLYLYNFDVNDDRYQIKDKILNKYKTKDIQNYIALYENNNISINSETSNNSLEILKDECFQNKMNENYIIKIIGFFKDLNNEKYVVFFNGSNKCMISKYILFIKDNKKIDDCNLVFNNDKFTEYIILHNNINYIYYNNKLFQLFNDSKLNSIWT